MKTTKTLVEPRLLFGSILFALALGALGGACSPVERSFGEPAADAGADAAVCEPGASVPCYEGPQGTAGVGSCKEGTKTCNGDGSAFGACDGQALPAPDICSTPEDEDCDGAPLVCPLTHVASAASPFPNNGELVQDIAVDPQGNAVLFASFEGALPFGDPSVVSTGVGTDLAVIKVDPQGKVLWARAYGGDGSQTPSGVAVDAAGVIYITGWFSSALDMGTGSAYMSDGSLDAFVAALDPAGEPVSVVVAGGADTQSPRRIRVGGDGSIFLAGGFTGKLAFPTGPVLDAGPNGEQRIFVAKLDPSLNVIDAVQSLGQGAQEINDLAVGAQGNPILTGSFNTSLMYGNTTITSLGLDDIFVVKLNGKDMKPLWLRTFGDKLPEQGKSIDVDSKGEIAVTGLFQGQIQVGAAILNAPADESIFVAKLQPTGDPIWAIAPGGGVSGTDFPFVRVDSKDNIVVGGTFTTIMDKPPLDFGGGPLQSTQGAGFGLLDLYLAKLAPDGAHIASKMIGNDQVQLASALGVLSGDTIMLTGGIIGVTDFGGGPLGADKVQSYFFAMFSP